MFSQDWPLAFEPMEMYPRYPFPEAVSDPVRSFMTEYQAPTPITEQPFFAPEVVISSAMTPTQAAGAASVQAAGFLEGLPTWALLLGGGGLLLLLGKRKR